MANAPAVAGSLRHPPRRFVSSPLAAPTAPLGSACLASPACHRFHLDLDESRRLAHALPSNWPGADGDADDDVHHCCGRKGEAPLRAVHAKMSTTSPPSFTTTPPSQHQREQWSHHRPVISTSPMREIPQPVDDTGGTTPSPSVWRGLAQLKMRLSHQEKDRRNRRNRKWTPLWVWEPDVAESPS
ncbi:hypothetical protein MMC13_000828 [Lambiella insularis]|nr:hypothetical protein [Lambiella insularis]